MFQRIKDKIIEKEMEKLFKFLEKANYTQLKHDMMRTKWDALKAHDDDTYEFAETMWNVLDEFEKFFTKEVHQ